MEKIVMILIPVTMGILLLRILILPIKWGVKLALHILCGLLCLWLLNSAFSVTGVLIPINPVTAAISGILGIPGIGLLALLEILPF